MPGIVEAAATIPNKYSGVPMLSANNGRAGFLDIVELKIANNPIKHNRRKKILTDSFEIEFPRNIPSVKLLYRKQNL